jgi:SPX domain protein involved in polyphosphate accumulation
MALFGNQSRYEFKYAIDMALIPQIRKFIKPYTNFDANLKDVNSKYYTVRSIYFDTPELDFYYEKMDGLKIRKKLRVRTYDNGNDYAFLEIKRKYNNCVVKERTRLSISTIGHLINTSEHSACELPGDDYTARLVSGKFLYNLLKKGLLPTLLVVYEREAYQGKIIVKDRITIDSDLRVLIKPELGDILNNINFVKVTADQAILELKFNNRMPKWMKNLSAEFRLRKQSISKYCLGLDACRNGSMDGEIL